MLKIAELRKKAGLSQAALAVLLDVKQNTVANWETGIREPKIKMLINLSKIFDCTIDDLIDKEHHT